MKTKSECEFLRSQAKRKFDRVRSSWCDALRWALPHRANWILSQTPGERRNQHIVDPTHILALRSYVAGFMEGNTSATRPWYRAEVRDQNLNEDDQVRGWLQHFTQRTLNYLNSSNFYHAAGSFYYDYGVVNTGAHYMEVLKDGFFVHTLMPGSYFVLNNAYGEAVVLVREFSMNVRALVKAYGNKTRDGKADWSNFSNTVKTAYDNGDYSLMIDVVHIVMENPDYDYKLDDSLENRKWIEYTYEVGANNSHNFSDGLEQGTPEVDTKEDVFLKKFTSKRKPFIVGRSTEDFEYGEKGPTFDGLGLIKSLNKKAISKDIALEHIVNPAMQGPNALRKSYVSSSPGSFVPLDARAVGANQKLEPIMQISPAIGALIQDVNDLRQQVDKIYYADFLLYLSRNPKTRTAAETNAIVEEQQRIIGPNLQSLNFTYNVPVVEWVMDYVMFEDPYLEAPPAELEGKAIRPTFISVFAQAQRAADLPSIDRYMQAMAQVGQLNPKIWDKVNLDKYADLYEDRLYLPAGLNNPQSKVEAIREQAAADMRRKQALEETLPAMAKAAKDVSGLQEQQP